jgi:hypothetical protein
MTEERLPLAELLAKAGDGDFLRSLAEAVSLLRELAHPTAPARDHLDPGVSLPPTPTHPRLRSYPETYESQRPPAPDDLMRFWSERLRAS